MAIYDQYKSNDTTPALDKEASAACACSQQPQALGRQSIHLKKPVYLIESASIVGTKEGEGPLGSLFDSILSDDMNGCESWEEAESTLQRDAISMVPAPPVGCL